MMLSELPLLKGFLTGGSLIVAIGAQNAFVLNQGIRKQYPGVIASTCFVVDFVLIVAGVAGLGAIIQQDVLYLQLATAGGALFLTGYAMRAFYSALKPQALGRETQHLGSVWSAIITSLALSLLNPHVYLDTVVLVGAIGGALAPEQRIWFVLGAGMA